jgi:hypothetical protein
MAGSRLLTLLTVGALVLLATPFVPAWLAPLGLDFGTAPSSARALRREGERAGKLDAAIVATQDRSLAGGQIIRELLDGRLTLPAAARRLGALHADDAAFLFVVRVHEPGTTDDERLCRHLISIVGADLADEPARARAIRSRLEAELQAFLTDGGAVVAPTAGSSGS